MSSEQSLKDIVEFTKLPSTPEKQEIERKYLDDEIGTFDFYCLARAYTLKAKETN